MNSDEDVGIEKLIKSLEEAQKELSKVAQAVRKTDLSDPYAADALAENLKIKLEGEMMPLDPLHETIEEAQLEEETKRKTKSIMIQTAIDKRIKDLFS